MKTYLLAELFLLLWSILTAHATQEFYEVRQTSQGAMGLTNSNGGQHCYNCQTIHRLVCCSREVWVETVNILRCCGR